MTFAVAWVRKIVDCEELIVASDSRFSGGRFIDCVQKVLPLPRSDSFIACAGDTSFTYPLMHQVHAAISQYQRASDRSLDLIELKAHIIKALNGVLTHVKSEVRDMRVPEKGTELIFGGYTWHKKKFIIWRITYSESAKSFIATPAAPWFGGRAQICFAGDWKHEGRKRLIALLRERHGVTPQSDVEFKFDWEPFEVLRDALRERQFGRAETIGGAPQILKIYQHMNCRPIGVYWPKRENGTATVSGRHLLPYETPNIWMLDPDTLISSNP